MIAVSEVMSRSKGARGLAVIIHNDYKNAMNFDPLPGTTKDADAMIEAFTRLNFAVHPVKNVTKEEMKIILNEVASIQAYPKEYDCFAITFSGHGCSDGVIVSSDEQYVSLEEVIINPLNSPIIGAIPKLLFIDACRGNRELVNRGGPTVSVPSNMFVAYSTMKGYKSYEGMKGGSWMQILAKELMTSKKPVYEIITDTCKIMNKIGLQQPQVTTYNADLSIILSSMCALL